jgi:hypothetical protein
VQLKAGLRLASVTCDTVVMIVKGAGDVDLRCGGQPMVEFGKADTKVGADPAFSAGTQMGKRYADDDAGLEVLCTKPGAGSLSVGTTELPVKGAKPLPASD